MSHQQRPPPGIIKAQATFNDMLFEYRRPTHANRLLSIYRPPTSTLPHNFSLLPTITTSAHLSTTYPANCQQLPSIIGTTPHITMYGSILSRTETSSNSGKTKDKTSSGSNGKVCKNHAPAKRAAAEIAKTREHRPPVNDVRTPMANATLGRTMAGLK